MRPIAIGKFRKAEDRERKTPEIVPLSRLAEANPQTEWDTALVRRAIAVRRWRGLSRLAAKTPPANT